MGTDVMSLYAKIGIDTKAFSEGLNDAHSKFAAFGEFAKKGLATIASLSASAFAAAGAGVVSLTKSAVSAYGEYEQLVGGVNKLFGESSQQLQEYAAEAYKTSGLSANEYMEQATSFSAALINSLGGDTAKAAQMTDVAMRAMADNVNTFGSDMASVQNAFQGFAKQNYTMLDNLKLGYGGTKSEMERLIADANEYAASIGQASDLSIDSFADIIQAIELVQEKQNIAGATAKEAATTLQGSLTMTKSAWQNLVTGLANPDADLGKLVTEFTDSAKIAMKNILPIVKTGLQGVGKMVTELLPDVFKMIPDLLDDVLPELLDTIDVTITQTFPVLIDVLAKNMPLLLGTIAKAGKTIVKSLFSAIDKELSGNKIYDTIKGGFKKVLPILSDLGESLFTNGKELFNSIGNLMGRIDFGKIINSIVDAADKLAPFIKSAGDDLVWLFDNAISPLIEWAANNVLPAAIDAMTSAFRILHEVGEGIKPILEFLWNEFLKPLAEWTGDAVVITLQAVSDALGTVADGFEGFDWEGWYEDFDNFAENWKIGAGDIGQALLDNAKYIDEFFDATAFGEGWKNFWEGVGGAVSDAVDWVVKRFGDWKTGSKDIIDAISNDWTTGEQNLEKFGEKINDFVTDWKTYWESVGENVADAVDKIKEKLGAIKDFAKDAYQWGKDLVSSFANGIKDSFWEIEGALEGFGEKVYDYIHFSEPDKGPLSDFESYAPDMVKTFAQGIHDNAHLIEDEMNDLTSAMYSSINSPKITPYDDIQGGSGAGMTDNATINLSVDGQLMASVLAPILDVINGREIMLATRGRQL